MNIYTKNLSRLEFMVTLACTGRCKHCSEGEHTSKGEHIDGNIAANIVREVAEKHNIKSLMTFGGEPLLYIEDVYKIHSAARDVGIAERTLITNGFFSRDESKIQQAAKELAKSGVNGVLISVDAFHQETIPVESVIVFAKAIKIFDDIKVRVHPAWLVREDDDNPYNVKTKELLKMFNELGISTSKGNVIFPSGNALRYLSGYFDSNNILASPYEEDPKNIQAICVSPNGDVLGGNIYKSDIFDILEKYTP